MYKLLYQKLIIYTLISIVSYVMSYFDILPKELLLELGVKLISYPEIYAYRRLCKLDEDVFYHHMCNKITDAFRGLPSNCEYDCRKFSWMRIYEYLSHLCIGESSCKHLSDILNMSYKCNNYDEIIMMIEYKFILNPTIALALRINRLHPHRPNVMSHVKSCISEYAVGVLSKCKEYHQYKPYTHIDSDGYLIAKYFCHKFLYCSHKIDKSGILVSVGSDDSVRIRWKNYNL
jgi:hypothetical protein